MGENDPIPVDPDFAGDIRRWIGRHWRIKPLHVAGMLWVAVLLLSPNANAQAVRFDTDVTTVSAQCVAGKQCPVLSLPGTIVSVCGGSVSTLASCLAAPATTYTDFSAGTPCPTTAQLTPSTGGACLSTADAEGNAGFWALPGQYNYFLRVPATAGGGTYGPYPINVGASAGCPLGATCDASFSTLSAACTAAGTGTLYVTRTWSGLATASYASCAMAFLSNGIIKPASGQTVTLSQKTLCPNYQKCFDDSAGGAVVFSGSITVTPNNFGALADGTGTGGNDYATNWQAGYTSMGTYGGIMYIPSAPLCYAIGAASVYVPGNVTTQGDGNASCVQKLAGNNANPVFNAGSSFGAGGNNNVASSPSSNIWFKNFTIDGNKANITGISGDGFNQGINFSGVTNGGTVGMTVKNAYTGGISVICYGSPATNAGDNVQIIDTNITASRRNNFEPLCGTNSVESGGTNTNAGGGSLSEGVDAEPSAAGQFITGLTIKNVLFSGNTSGCIQAMFKYDTTWTMNLINNTCTVPNTTAGGVVVQTDTPVTHVANAGTLTISGGSYIAGSANAATISTQQAARVNMFGASASGSARGILSCSNCSGAQAGTVTTVVSSLLNGSSFDIDCFNTVSLVGVVLVNGTRGAGCAPYVTAMAGGVSASWQAGCIPTFLSAGSGQTNLDCSANFKATNTASSPGYFLNDGTGKIAKYQWVPGAPGFYFGTQTDDPMYIVQKNRPVLQPIAYSASNVSLLGILTPGSLSGATIPACSATYLGFLARFTDSDTQTWGATIAGSGVLGAVGYCNGSNWTVFAK